MPHTQKPFRCVLCFQDIVGQSRAMHEAQAHAGMASGTTKAYANIGNSGHNSGWRALAKATYRTFKKRQQVED